MAVTFVAAGSLAGNATVATQAITAPACNVDDILIAFLINKSAVTNVISPPDGTWTQIVQDNTDCTTAADDHRFAIFWKRAVSGNSGASFTFTKATDDNVLFAGVISAWRGCPTSGDPLDATAVGVTKTLGATTSVNFPAFDPTEVDSHIIYAAFYGNDATTFAAAMSADTNPDCTKRFDLETATGSDASIAVTSGDTTDGSNIPARTWNSGATTTAGSTAVVFALKPALVGNTVTPGVGALIATGFAAVVTATANQIVAAGVGALLATGFAPTVSVANPQTVSPGVGVVTATGYAPTVSNGGFTPLNLSPHIWVDASQESYSDNDAVGTVNDFSGNNRDATQATTANKPTYKTGIVNGKPVFRFSTDDFVAFGDVLTGLTAGEVFVVYKIALSNNVTPLWAMGSSGDAFIPFSDTQFYDDFGSNARKSTGSPATGPSTGFIIYNVTSKSGGWTSRVNGVQHYTTGTNTVGWATTPYLGRNTNGNHVTDADIAEFILVGSELSSGDRADTLSYLGTKYGISVPNPQTVTPGTGVLTATGYAPAVSASDNKIVAPDVGAVTATGFAPSVTASDHKIVTPALGQLTATGFSPTVTVNVRVLPGVGALSAAGFAPTVSVSNNQTVAPALGQLTATGFAPTVTVNVRVLPGGGALTATGFAASVSATANQFVAPGVGVLTASGFAPALALSDNQVVATDVGTLTATGFAPTVSATANQFVAPGRGELSAAGFAPSVSATANQYVEPGTGEATLEGFAPSIDVSDAAAVNPGVGQVIATGFAPVVTASDHQTVAPATGVLAASGFAPSVIASAHQTVAPNVGTVTVTGFAPSVFVGDAQVVQPGTGTVAATGYAPSITTTGNQYLAPSTGEVVATGFAPSVTATISDFDAIAFDLTGQPRIAFDLTGGHRIRSFLSAEPRIKFKLTGVSRVRSKLTAEPKIKLRLTAKPGY